MRSALTISDAPPDLILDFFATFSRFEFALKDVGFIFPARGRAMPDWQAFSATVGEKLDRDDGLREAIHFLVSDPPRVQIFANGRIALERPKQQSDSPAAFAIECARIVRNNLFHGGKHSPHSPEGRDALLLRAALDLLAGCLRHSPKLLESFDQEPFA